MHPEIEGRPAIQKFLAQIATGRAPFDVIQRWYPDRFNQLRQSPDFEAQLAMQRSWVRAAHDALSGYIPTFAGLLCDRELYVRAEAALLFGHFGRFERGEPARCFDILRAHIDSGNCDDQVAIVCIFSMRQYASALKNGAEPFKALLREGSRPAVRLAAAIALAHTMRERTPPHAVDVIAADLHTPVVIDDDDWYRPWHQVDNPFTKCAEALGLAGSAAVSALPELIKLLDARPDGNADWAAAILLRVVFPTAKPAGKRFADLSEPQKYVLRALAESRTLWSHFDPDEDRKDGNVMALLESYGLPKEPSSFRAFVDGTDQVHDRNDTPETSATPPRRK